MSDALTSSLPGFTPAWWQLLVDHQLDHSTVRLYLILASHARAGRPVAFPSQARLADLMDCSIDTVWRCINQLVKAGWLVKQQRGVRRTNLYHLAMPAARTQDWYTDEAVDRAVDGAVDDGPDSAPTRSQDSAPTRSPIGSRRTGSREIAHLAVSAHAESFDEWWDAWPRKVAKADAMKAYAKALSVTTAGELLEGARMVRADHQRMTPAERKFVPYPATWLNRGQWADQHDPVEEKPVVIPRCVLCGACPAGVETCRIAETEYAESECMWK